MLGHARVEVVLYHRHYGGGLARLRRVFVYVPGIHRVIRAEAVHVDAAVGPELMGEFLCQHRMVLWVEIPQRVFQRQGLFLV